MQCPEAVVLSHDPTAQGWEVIDLCVECDERGHLEYYNAVEEAARQAYVEKELACRFLRFNPNAIDFDLSDVISDILDVYSGPVHGEHWHGS